MGLAEFSNIPMARPPDEGTCYEFFQSKHTTDYLERYIDRHGFAGRSPRDRIVFEFKVDSVKKPKEEWIISGRDSSKATRTLHADEVIVASGLAFFRKIRAKNSVMNIVIVKTLTG